MYCANCGTENQQDARFCYKCGAELKSVGAVATQNYNEIRLDNEAVNRIGQLAQELQQLDNAEKVLAKKQRELTYLNESVDRNNKNKSSNFILILVMVAISIGIVQVMLFLLFFIFKGNLPWVLSLLISIIIAVVVDKKIYHTVKSKVEKYQNEEGEKLKEKQAKTKTECELIEKDRQQFIKVISDKIDIIPPNYRYQMAVQYIYESLSNMRARDITEAVNLYEEQLHRWKMEAAQEQMVELTRQQNTVARINMAANVVGAAANVANASLTKNIAKRLWGD